MQDPGGRQQSNTQLTGLESLNYSKEGSLRTNDTPNQSRVRKNSRGFPAPMRRGRSEKFKHSSFKVERPREKEVGDALIKVRERETAGAASSVRADPLPHKAKGN